LAQGIVIPWLIEGSIWRLSIRDERMMEGEQRYRQVSGGSNGLYLAESLQLERQAVVLVEGEFDALSVAQECGDLVAVVATGTTKGSRTPRWISLLARQERVLVTFDAERDKGDVDAGWWMERMGNAERLRPLWKDANQMLRDGVDLRLWISSALVKPQAPMEKTRCEPSGVIDKVPLESRPAWLTRCALPSMIPSSPAIVVKRQTCCAFVHAVADRKGHIRGAPCQGEPLAGINWCQEHQQVQALLDLGAQIGYPAVHLTRHRTIGSGSGSWQAYACRAPVKWLCRDLVVIRSLVPIQCWKTHSVAVPENWPATG
jgi:hypothetical protein